MSKRDKALARARNSPKGWTALELGSLLGKFGFTYTAGGKHDHYESPRDASLYMPVPRGSGELPAGYVRDAVRHIDCHLALDEK